MSNSCIINGTLTGSLKNEILRGMSAYEIAVKNGFIGTEVQWLESLRGEDAGDDAVRYIEQDLTEEEKKQARKNIGAAGRDFMIGYVRNVEDELELHKTNDSMHMSRDEKELLEVVREYVETGHAPGDAEKNQNAFSNIQVGDTIIEADNVTDTISFVAGDNIVLTPEGKSITISAEIPEIGQHVESITSGTEDGSISVTVNGEAENVFIKGLGSAAFSDAKSFDIYGSAYSALTDSKSYTDELANGQVTANTDAITKNADDIATIFEAVNGIEHMTIEDVDAMF